MMIKSAFPAIDAVHLALMLVALSLSYYLPFELVLLSYAILGPLHYLTEISWLHERSYFMSQRYFAWFLVMCTALLVFLHPERQGAGFIFYSALAFSAAFALFKTLRARLCAMIVGLLIAILITHFSSINVPFVILLPTVIHISLFTFLFMVVGALRSRSVSQMFLVVAYILCIGLIFAHPPVADSPSQGYAIFGPKFFGSVGTAFGQIFGPDVWPFNARLAGFLSFAYTYHYLNWFIKVRVIKWSDVPKERLLVIAIVGIGVTSFYFINYALGFVVLTGLSLLHVFLEFPLNVLSIKQLGGMARPSRSAVS